MNLERDEAALVARARSGDMNAFEELVFTHQGFVYNLALRSLGDPAEAEDIAQEAFIRAWNGLARFEERALFRTWLYRIVVNLCYNRLPRLRKEFAALSIEEEPGEDSPIVLGALGGTGNSHQDPVRQVEAGERRSFLEEQVKNLPRSQRILIFLRFHQDCSYEEIAEIMGMPLGTVKTGLHRARQQLKTALKAGEETYV